MTAKRVLSVGQCMADHGSIARTLRTAFGVEVVSADRAEEALAKLRGESFDLVLVNRVLDADGSPGLDVLHALKADARAATVPAMLVSNYEDAQEQAVAAGAVPGFGKSSLGRPEMLQRVGAILGDTRQG